MCDLSRRICACTEFASFNTENCRSHDTTSACSMQSGSCTASLRPTSDGLTSSSTRVHPTGRFPILANPWAGTSSASCGDAPCRSMRSSFARPPYPLIGQPWAHPSAGAWRRQADLPADPASHSRPTSVPRLAAAVAALRATCATPLVRNRGHLPWRGAEWKRSVCTKHVPMGCIQRTLSPMISACIFDGAYLLDVRRLRNHASLRRFDKILIPMLI